MSYRIERVNNLIRHELSDLLRLEVKDPRLSTMVTITEVSVSTDLKHARVYVSHLGTEEEKQQTIEGLTAASGFLRKELAKHIRMRHIPELSFQWDSSIETGAHILDLIEKTSQNEKNR